MTSAHDILSIPLSEPERLFPNSEFEADSIFRKLAKQWHPDRNANINTTDVMAHISALHSVAVKKIKDKTWAKIGTRIFHCADGKSRRLQYHIAHTYELGEYLVGETVLLHTVSQDSADLFHAAVKTIKNLSFTSVKIENEISRYLPNPISIFEAGKNSILVQHKTSDVYCLRDVLNACGGKLEANHVAWILNRLYNIACYFEVSKLTHNDISLDSVFISPKTHSAMLYGGWWYSLPLHAKISALPIRSVNLAPYGLLNDKKADHRLDLTLIKALGRELLGDPSGMMLPLWTHIPKPITDFLRQPCSHSARQDYEIWEAKVLPASFGKRKFVKMAVTKDDVYPKR